MAPNLLPILASSLLFTILYSIGAYVTLAYIGLTSISVWNWGTMLFWAQSNNAPLSGEWYWFVPPGICIALVGTSLALLNFGIDEFINPRLRAGGLSGRQRRRLGMPRRQRLGLTPVVRSVDDRAAGHRAGTESGDVMTTESKRVDDVVATEVPPLALPTTTYGPIAETTHVEAAMGERILDVRNFSVDYGWGENAVRAVDDVDVHIDRSKVLGIAGESGSGKSTLVYAITRLLRAPGVIKGGEARFNLGSDDEGRTRHRSRERQRARTAQRPVVEHLDRAPERAQRPESRRARRVRSSSRSSRRIARTCPSTNDARAPRSCWRWSDWTRTAWTATPTNSRAASASAS